ncbi:MAG: hypothetical protein LUM44_23185 [Pyrinomonadaceae bacterium]|nr:hypothetical protein [Pyrinomonadaceae bacterium]
MKSEKIKQFSVSILVVLSLFVSSISACYCAHHAEKAELETPSCHGKTHEAEKQDDAAQTNDADSFNVSCECSTEAAPKVFAKSENVKIEKQTAKLADSINFEIKEVLQKNSVAKIEFSKPLYLSDSFYNLKSPRAPPTV